MRLKHSKLTATQTLRLCEHFVAGTPARTAAALIGVNKNTAALFYHRMRQIIADRIADDSPFHGEEVDESYFGGVRKGRRGRGAAGKTPVFGILKRGGRVYTTMIPNARTATLLPIIQAKVKLDSVVYYRRVRQLRHSRCLGLPPSSDQAFQSLLDRVGTAHQWHRKLLESGQAPSAQAQRHPNPPLSPVPQRVRMALQLWLSGASVEDAQALDPTLKSGRFLGQPHILCRPVRAWRGSPCYCVFGRW